MKRRETVGMLARVREDPFSERISRDEVPEADAAEQLRPVTEPTDIEDAGIADDGPPPLETSESDWQEQRLVVEDPDPDEMR